MKETNITENIEELADDVLAGKTEVYISTPDSGVSFGKGVLAGTIGCGFAYGVYRFGKWALNKITAKKSAKAEIDEENVEEEND